MTFQTGSSLIQVTSNAESSNWNFLHYFWPVLSYRLSVATNGHLKQGWLVFRCNVLYSGYFWRLFNFGYKMYWRLGQI